MNKRSNLIFIKMSQHFSRPRSRFFETSIEEDDEEIKSKVVEAQNSYRSKNYEHATECWNQLIKLDPFRYEHYLNRSLCYFKVSDMEKAYLDAKKSVELNPYSNTETMKHFMTIAVECNKIDDAICFIENLGFKEETKFLKDLEQLESRMKKNEEQKNLDRKLFHLMWCLYNCPNSIRYILEKADALIRNDQSENVGKIINIDLNGEIRSQNYVQGLLYLYRDNDLDKALEFFQLISCEKALIQDDLYRKAKSKYDSITTLKEKLDKGKEACENLRFPEAYDLYTEALNIDEWIKKINANIHFNRGEVLIKMEKKEEALTDLNKAIDLKSRFVDAVIVRAELHFELDLLDCAIEDYERAFSFHSDEISTDWLVLALVLRGLRNHYYEALLKKIYFSLGSKDYKESLRVSLKGLKSHVEPEHKIQFEDICLKIYQKLVEECYGEEQTAHFKNITFNDGVLKLIEKYLKNGNKNEFIKHYETIFRTKSNKEEEPINYEDEDYLRSQQRDAGNLDKKEAHEDKPAETDKGISERDFTQNVRELFIKGTDESRTIRVNTDFSTKIVHFRLFIIISFIIILGACFYKYVANILNY